MIDDLSVCTHHDRVHFVVFQLSYAGFPEPGWCLPEVRINRRAEFWACRVRVAGRSSGLGRVHSGEKLGKLVFEFRRRGWMRMTRGRTCDILNEYLCIESLRVGKLPLGCVRFPRNLIRGVWTRAEQRRREGYMLDKCVVLDGNSDLANGRSTGPTKPRHSRVWSNRLIQTPESRQCLFVLFSIERDHANQRVSFQCRHTAVVVRSFWICLNYYTQIWK